MITLVCFGDSNTWGYDPDASAYSPFPIRHPIEVRWTGVLAGALGARYRVLEEGQNGRTTVHDDPFNPARNGAKILPAILESHKPIDAVVMMLGSNDLKRFFNLPASEIANGAAVLARLVLRSDSGPAGQPPQLLLLCPPRVGDMGHLPDLGERFADGEPRSRRFPLYFQRLAVELNCAYLDTQPLLTVSRIDHLHFDADNHRILGLAVAESVRRMFPADE